MKKDLGTKADGFNSAETKEDCSNPSRGGIPKIIQNPIRKRAYYRALKRGEFWAKYKKSMDHIMDSLNYSFFSDVFTSNPLLKMIGLKETLDSYNIEISYGSTLPKDDKK